MMVFYLALLLLVIVTGWLEIRRKRKQHLLLRLIACVIAVASIFFMIVSATWQQTTTINKKEITVVTESNGEDGSIKKINGEVRAKETANGEVDNSSGGDNKASAAATKQYTTKRSLAGNNTQYLPDLRTLIESDSAVSAVRITGNGLPEEDLAYLRRKNILVRYNNDARVNGFVHAHWPRTIRLNEELHVRGTFASPGNGPIKFFLEGFGNALDSAVSNDTDRHQFHLRYVPNHTGITILHLRAVEKSGREWKEKVPVFVEDAVPMQVLVLSSSPDFESRFIASWLSDNRYSAAIRSAVSPGRYTTRFLSMPSIPLQQVNASLLEKFDAVIADDEALSQLSAPESGALAAQVQSGLGLVVRSDSSRTLSRFSSAFNVTRSANPARNIKLEGSIAPLPPAAGFTVVPDASLVSLISNTTGQPVAAVALSGSGRIILTTLNDTYTWWLAGRHDEYSKYWTSLLNEAARRKTLQGGWKSDKEFPVANEKITLSLLAPEDSLPSAKADGAILPFTQDRYLRDRWTTTWWPRQSGWQILGSPDTSMLYIYEEGDWLAARTAKLISTNRFYADRKMAADTMEQTMRVTTTRSVSTIIFFILFIACCSYLWFEGKKNSV